VKIVHVNKKERKLMYEAMLVGCGMLIGSAITILCLALFATYLGRQEDVWRTQMFRMLINIWDAVDKGCEGTPTASPSPDAGVETEKEYQCPSRSS
jgi:hypothetical protein